jgi:hypothetical protein
VLVVGASAPVFRATNFSGNALGAVRNTGSLAVDARASWWGHASGPSGAGLGSGEAVLGSVAHNPWLETPPNPALYATEGEIAPLVFVKTSQAADFLAALSDAAAWALAVRNTAGEPVMTYGGVGAAVAQPWNGEQSGSSEPVPDGVYTLRLAAATAGASMAPLVGRVHVTGSQAPVAAILSPVPDGVVSAAAPVAIFGSATALDGFVSRLRWRRACSRPGRRPPALTVFIRYGSP